MSKTLTKTVSELKGLADAAIQQAHASAAVSVHPDDLKQMFDGLALGGEFASHKIRLEQELAEARGENARLHGQLAAQSDDFQAANARIAELVADAKKQPEIFEQLRERANALQSEVAALNNPTRETLERLIAEYAAKRGIVSLELPTPADEESALAHVHQP